MTTSNLTNNTNAAVIYCRVSTKEQVEEGNSLLTQEKVCRQFALDHGYTVLKVFIEQGESAKTQDRTEFQQLLKYCTNKNNGVKAIIAYKIDRISRNIDDYSQIRMLLKKYSVEIKSTSEQFENNPVGRFMENMLANVAEFDNGVRAERCSNGMKEAVREGRYVWLAPLGYENVKVGDKSTIAPNKSAPLVKKMFEEISVSSCPLEEIRKKIGQEGLQTKNNNAICKAQFYRMIRNELYSGWIIKFGERHRGLFEPIISDDLFEKVQRVLRNRGRHRDSYTIVNGDFPLRRYVKNTKGDLLTGAWSTGRYRKYPYYRFTSSSKSFPKDLLESSFKKLLDELKFDKKSYKEFVSTLKKNYESTISRNQRAAVGFEKQIDVLKNERHHLFIQHHKELINDLVFKEEIQRIQDSIDDLSRKAGLIPSGTEDFSHLIELASEYLHSPSSVWEKAKVKHQIALQRFNFPEGLILEGTKFRTTVLRNIYKAKPIFLSYLSPVVDYPNLSLNHQQGTKSTHKWKDPPPKVDWQAVTNDMLELGAIMKEIKEEPP